ncbi:MAG: glycosyltransferase family 9 protein [Desulfarculaceae bacterium]|jgi:heptosyltransferase-2
MHQPRRILAMHFGALGDFILSWPALGLLAKGPPWGEITLIGQPEFAHLVLPPERVRDREAAALVNLFTSEPDPRLEAWLGEFDLAVVFARNPDQNLIRRLSRAAETWPIPTQPQSGQVRHVSDLQVDRLKGYGLSGDAPALTVRPAKIEAAPCAVIAPGSGGKKKGLSPAQAGRLAGRLKNVFPSLKVILGPAEEDSFRSQVVQAIDKVDAEIILDPPLAHLAAILASASVYVGADSGVSHLAASVGTLTVVGFADSDPRLWAPRGPKVVTAAGCRDLEHALDKALSLAQYPGKGKQPRPHQNLGAK